MEMQLSRRDAHETVTVSSDRRTC